ncbi:hypothetical protein [Henriciella litoralis]|uniref:hypothetical protein n=1 Tax=Henriciella litoralis TaxID=568102 RepID=UPI0009FDD4AD|nr:hypothetical protein [Henriciella litoralis]
MAAKKKHFDDPNKPASVVTPDAAPSLREAGETHSEEVSSSPARELQEHLEQKIAAPSPKRQIMDMGRVLASASGITAILGVFIFSGIW